VFVPFDSFVVVGTVTTLLITRPFPLGTGAVYSFDPVGSYEREACRAAGAAQSLVQPFLDNQVSWPLKLKGRNTFDTSAPLPPGSRVCVIRLFTDLFPRPFPFINSSLLIHTILCRRSTLRTKLLPVAHRSLSIFLCLQYSPLWSIRLQVPPNGTLR